MHYILLSLAWGTPKKTQYVAMSSQARDDIVLVWCTECTVWRWISAVLRARPTTNFITKDTAVYNNSNCRYSDREGQVVKTSAVSQ
jgi:hypothetical protein